MVSSKLLALVFTSIVGVNILHWSIIEWTIIKLASKHAGNVLTQYNNREQAKVMNFFFKFVDIKWRLSVMVAVKFVCLCVCVCV